MSKHRPTVSLLGFHFTTAKHIRTLVNEIMDEVPVEGVRHLITPNASQVVYYHEAANRGLKSFYTDSRFILPDGMPIVWLSRLKGISALHRLPGSDLFPELWPHIKAGAHPAVFVVPNEQIAAKLREEHAPGAVIVPPMFRRDDDDYIAELAREVALAVRTTNAHFVFLGLGFPKQEKLGLLIALQLKDVRHSVLILLLGASFEFHFGFKPRAPRWMQESGLEWLHRLMQEPGRLWKRYTVDSFRFIMLALKEVLSRKPA